MADENYSELDEVPTASLGKWIFLIVVAAVSFWSQATVTEERFVPALNVIANKFNIPDDIAGATLMAAGASSPELFSSFVALFITHSSLGLGTVFGSEVFNQLIICAGAVYSSKTGKLELNRAVVTREVFFYALGIVALFFALQDTEPVADDPSGIDHIVINFADAVMVFIGYVFYVMVCANMDAVVGFVTRFVCCGGGDGSGKANAMALSTDTSTSYGSTYGSVRHESIQLGGSAPFMMPHTSSLAAEPKGNFDTVEYHTAKHGGKSTGHVFSASAKAESDFVDDDHSVHSDPHRQPSMPNDFGKYSDGRELMNFKFLVSKEKPSDDHRLLDIEVNTYEERLSCFMWQRSYFYNKARFANHGWNLRWFSLMHDQVYSVPDRANFERHKIRYPAFTEIVIDQNRHIIKLCNPNPKKRNFYLMAPSEEIMEQVVEKFTSIMNVHIQQIKDAGGLVASSPDSEGEGIDSNEDVESLIEFPSNGSLFGKILFVLLYPVRVLMHFTSPDVRTLDSEGNPNATLGNATIAVISCLLWLIVGSYAMVASLEALAELMDIPDAVIGYTVSAAGTSLPNYVASAVAARNGFGNMAVSNALGSNTFNIMIGLGLPWVLYTSFGTGFEPYDELRNEGITEGVLILGAVLLLLVVLLLQSGFVLYMWHGHLFVVCYVGYLVYVIGGVYFW